MRKLFLLALIIPLYFSSCKKDDVLVPPTVDEQARDIAAYNHLMGKAQAGVTNTFLFQIPDGRDSTITSTKSSFTLNSVILYDTLHLKSGIAGHLVFDQLIPQLTAHNIAA